MKAHAELIFKTPSGHKLTYPLLQCSYEFGRPVTESNNRPHKAIKGGIISLTLKTHADVEILHWAMKPHQSKKGTIFIYDHMEEMTSVRVIDFEDAHCVYFKEQAIEGNAIGAIVSSLIITANKININGIEHDNNWEEKQVTGE